MPWMPPIQAATQRYMEQRFWVVVIPEHVFQWVLVLLHDMVTEQHSTGCIRRGAANSHSRAHVKKQPAPAMAATPSSPEGRESRYWGRKEGTLLIKAADINLPLFWSLPQPAVIFFVLSKLRFHTWNSSMLQKYPGTEWKALGESPKIQAKEFRNAF